MRNAGAETTRRPARVAHWPRPAGTPWTCPACGRAEGAIAGGLPAGLCEACLERRIGLPGQIAFLLVDLYGRSEVESAVRLGMPLLRFRQLLTRARAALALQRRGDSGRTRGRSPDRPADTAAAPERSAHVEIHCGLDLASLQELREKLVDGLGGEETRPGRFSPRCEMAVE